MLDGTYGIDGGGGFLTISPGGAPAAYGGGFLNGGWLTPCGCGPTCGGFTSGTGSRGREAAFSLGPGPKPKSVTVVGGALTLVLGFGGGVTIGPTLVGTPSWGVVSTGGAFLAGGGSGSGTVLVGGVS